MSVKSTNSIHVNQIKVCHTCGLLQKLPETNDLDNVFTCVRCHSRIETLLNSNSIYWTRSCALSALICYPIAISLPALKIEQLGTKVEKSILGGIVQMYEEGYLFLALIVFLCSIVLPILKLIGLYLISTKQLWLSAQRKAWIYHMVEVSGRYGMLDVLLIAVLVAVLKMRDLVNVYPGPGAIAFCCCVLFSLLSSSFFNPHLIWSNDNESYTNR